MNTYPWCSVLLHYLPFCNWYFSGNINIHISFCDKKIWTIFPWLYLILFISVLPILIIKLKCRLCSPLNLGMIQRNPVSKNKERGGLSCRTKMSAHSFPSPLTILSSLVLTLGSIYTLPSHFGIIIIFRTQKNILSFLECVRVRTCTCVNAYMCASVCTCMLREGFAIQAKLASNSQSFCLSFLCARMWATIPVTVYFHVPSRHFHTW